MPWLHFAQHRVPGARAGLVWSWGCPVGCKVRWESYGECLGTKLDETVKRRRCKDWTKWESEVLPKTSLRKHLTEGPAQTRIQREGSTALLLARGHPYTMFASFPMWTEGHFCRHRVNWEIRNQLLGFFSFSFFSQLSWCSFPHPQPPHPHITTLLPFPTASWQVPE